MIKLLEEIDELLTYLEDTAHGEEGKRITEMRYKILTELSNSHKHGVMQAEGSDGFCVSCEKNKVTHELCLECAVKLGRENTKDEEYEAAVGNSAAGKSGSAGNKTS